MQHHPLPEYPRPALRRDSYENLNGLWQYAITSSAGLPAKWDGDILVPYSPETKASGVGRTLQPGAWLHYHRSFVPPAGTGGRVLLHFGAVDYACAVQVNGHLVGGHRGGYWPFALDITDALNPAGHDRLWVAVQDPTGTGVQARGKQTLRPGGMFYPAQSGIWQTVWLERVPENYITELTVTPDYDARTVTVKAHTSLPGGAANLWAVVRAGGVTIAEDWGSDEADRDGAVTLHIPEEHFFPWSPDSPFLYDLTVGTTQGEEEQRDTVHSYFALRKWSCAPDAHGIMRFCLNGKPILLNGLLDQGYWPEGLYTPPSDAAVERELSEVKALGYNLLRKHAKIEPQRWYYHCDRLGLVVWQDMVNGGSKYNLWFVTYLTNVLQPLMRRLPDKAALWGLLSRGSESSREEYRRELEDTVQALRCHPCVGCWVPFNEGWGQYDAAGAVQAIASSFGSSAPSAAVMVTRYSASEIVSTSMLQPLLSASRRRFCTAVSLSTSVSTLPSPPSDCSARSVFTTGSGQASPIALIRIITLPPSCSCQEYNVRLQYIPSPPRMQAFSPHQRSRF